MTARYLVGDVFDRLAEIPAGSIDLVLTSPPFLGQRDYLPADHPDKAKEIGNEAAPANYLDSLLAVTAEFRRILAPHGSIAIELGDTYSGAGGYGSPDSPNPAYGGSDRFAERWEGRTAKRFKRKDDGWPLDKSLCLLPTLYPACLAYGRNLLTGEASPAGMWRLRNLKPWIRSNPPVGDLGDKERPGTSYITVATLARDRYFDLDAVRVGNPRVEEVHYRTAKHAAPERGGERETNEIRVQNPAGAPPLDWWHPVDAVLDAALEEYVGGTTHPRGPKGTRRKSAGKQAAPERGGNWMTLDTVADGDGDSTRVRGRHLRRALERAGILRTVDALDVSPTGYRGAHYAVWPKELVRLLVDEMCPRRVCTTCGQPSRRIVDAGPSPYTGQPGVAERRRNGRTKGPLGLGATGIARHGDEHRRATTLGWSDCGHDTWRPGLVLDPFAGSGTTLAVVIGMGRDAIGVDLDERNAQLAADRAGMFLETDYGRTPSEAAG